MVQRPKRPTPRRRAQPEVAVVLETMSGQFRAFGEALQIVDGHVQSVDAHLQGFQKEVGARFQQVDARFDAVDARLGRVEHDVALLKDAVVANTRELKRLSAVGDKKVDRDEIEPIVEGILPRLLQSGRTGA